MISRSGKIFLFSLPAVCLFCLLLILYVDRAWAIYIYDHFRETTIKEFFSALTYLGEGTWLAIGAAVLLVFFQFIKKNKVMVRRMWFLLLVLALTGVTSNLIKVTTGRLRPKHAIKYGVARADAFPELHELDDHEFDMFATKKRMSFPSGHAATAMAALLAVCWMWRWVRIPVVTLGTLVILSRLFTHSHYISDLVFGVYMSYIICLFMRDWFRKKGWDFEAPPLPIEPPSPSAANAPPAASPA